MILSDEYVLRALELKVKTIRIRGTLCKIVGDVTRAMLYHDCYNYEEYLSNPFAILPEEVIRNLTPDTARILAHYLHHYAPPFTHDEIRCIIRVASNFGYRVIHNKGYITMRKEVPHE